MGRPPWATPKQLDWLQNNVPKYHEAQAQGRLSEFFPETIAAFFQKFPFKAEAEGIADATEDGVDYTRAPDLRKARKVCPPSIKNQ